MPALDAEIQVAGLAEPVDTFSVLVEQPTDQIGQPSAEVRVRPVLLTLTGLAAMRDFFTEWAVDSHMRRSGHIVVYENDQTRWRLTFYDAYCVLHHIHFRPGEGRAAYELMLALSPAAVDLNGVHSEIHSDLWWEKDADVRFRALTKPAELLPSPSLRATLRPASPSEPTSAVADFMRFKQEKKPLSERPQSKKTGYLGSPKLTKTQLAALTKIAQEQYGVAVQVVKPAEMLLIAESPDARAVFQTKLNAEGQRVGNVYVQKGVTAYELTHELMHAKQFHQLGYDIYWLKQTRLQREEFVLTELMKNKNQWSAAENKHANDYIAFVKDGKWSGR